ncbi:DUF1778 domain-containing protein [Neopusillimonas aromaticivorans]|uniref:type II toxin-antitoxin system TacA family antitoxin n=1 Tax=Neopusillimonas aromaticivorans TaxID=2979868 RepID=UPI0025995073|nr:DUF1778 domain-containing protein [Neopusillimonas aromaticivorans]WJJ93291.1 DUF1778 domain-containing protein [Neopusillimonas aromaticivorans]
MSALTLKNARMELKTTKEAKELLSKAALLDGVDVSSFMLASAMEKARAVLRDHGSIQLSAEGQVRLAHLLQDPPAPTPAMKKLRNKPRLEVRE